MPCPPVVYDGGRHVVERACKGIIENGSYELFGVDGGCTYYGTYRCIKVTTMDWDKLKSLGQEVRGRSLSLCQITPSEEVISSRGPFWGLQ